MIEVPADKAGRAARWRRVPGKVTAGGHGPGQLDQASRLALKPLGQISQRGGVGEEFAEQLYLLGGYGQALTVDRVEDAYRVTYHGQTL